MFEHIGQFARKGGFARTLQTRHQYDGRAAFDVYIDVFAAHQLCQFVVHNLHHHLVGFDGQQHVLPEGFGFYVVGKRFGDFVVDVGIEQRFAHIFERFGNVYFGYPTLSFQYFERPFEAFA